MVEMALVLPIYFLLVYGMMQICFVLFAYCNATYAVRVAGRYAAVHGTGSTYQCTASDLQNITQQYLWGVPKNNTTVTSTWSPNNSPGSLVTIKISMIFTTAIPFSQTNQFTVGTAVTEVILQ